ncbi:unnamed protein product, partial [Allacma fusca]
QESTERVGGSARRFTDCRSVSAKNRCSRI